MKVSGFAIRDVSEENGKHFVMFELFSGHTTLELEMERASAASFALALVNKALTTALSEEGE